MLCPAAGKTKAAIEKRNKQGGGVGGAVGVDTDDIRSKELLRFEMEQRERELKRREQEVEKREDLVKVRQAPKPQRSHALQLTTSCTRIVHNAHI